MRLVRLTRYVWTQIQIYPNWLWLSFVNKQSPKTIAIPFSPAVIVIILTLKAVISISVLSPWVHLANTKWPESPMLRKKIPLLVIFLTRIDKNTWKGGSQDLVNRPTLRKGHLHFDSPTLRKSCRCRSYRPSSACAPEWRHDWTLAGSTCLSSGKWDYSFPPLPQTGLHSNWESP